ncbi:efflux RND transporter periplasmic adaptor subunit [Gilvimarinus sp. F26214L]|uniref:efflux RND transporter periplasmic adaptor subunit n=1 Tax=Gilvimarinus sp. DZF01 TaxID=3461371 RepID=UPI0040457D60
MSIQPQRISLKEELPGRTVAAKVAEIRPQVSGIVTRRLFTEGAMVEAGEQLYQIDDSSYRAELERAKAELQRAEAAARVAKSRLDRYEGLVKSQAISQQDLEDAQAGYDQAKASIAAAKAAISSAEINLRYTRVLAPISGRIGISEVTEGALVTQNQAQTLTRITQLDPIYVDMPQSSTEYWKLRQALQENNRPAVSLRIGGHGQEYAHQGTLEFGGVTVDQSTGSVLLRAALPNPDHVLLPGLFVKAQILTGERDAVLVPQRATSRNPNGQLQVWTVGPDNTAQPVTVVAEGQYADQWIVSDGLQPGDVIVMQGYQKLSPGASVSTVAYGPDDRARASLAGR